ncbi:DNA glycosylase AlkZ-like family protein [Streptomyces sp. NPDC054796]
MRAVLPNLIDTTSGERRVVSKLIDKRCRFSPTEPPPACPPTGEESEHARGQRDQAPPCAPVRLTGTHEELLALSDQIDHLRTAEPLPDDHVRLLAFEGPALKGYFTTRHRYLDPAHATAAFNPIGEVRATITLGGRVQGTWHWDKQTRRVRTHLFTRLPRHILRAVQSAAEEAEAFLRSEQA